MSHVDKGALHAYLDGALDALSSGEARWIREHLERCPQCVAALEEERRVRDAAGAVLARAVPAVEIPPLEELRTRARSLPSSGEVPRRWSRLQRLGWAASVTIALGVGWLARGPQGEVRDDGSRGVAVTAERVEASAGSAAEVAAVAGPEGLLADAAEGTLMPAARPELGAAELGVRELGRQGSREEGPSAPAEGEARSAGARLAEVVRVDRSAGSPVGDEAEGVDGVAVGAAPLRVGARPVDRVAPVASPAGSETAALVGVDGVIADRVGADHLVAVERGPGSGEAVDAGEASAAAPAEEREAEEADRTLSGVVITSAFAQGGAAPDLGVVEKGDGSGADDAGSSGSLVVPGLEVLSISWREEGVRPGGVQVLQRLEGGDTLELIHLPEGLDPGVVPPPIDGRSELVTRRDSGWLIMRARLDRAELELLRARLDPVP